MKIELKNNILQLRGISFADTDAVFAYFHTAKKKRYEYYQTNRVSINNRIIHGIICCRSRIPYASFLRWRKIR